MNRHEKKAAKNLYKLNAERSIHLYWRGVDVGSIIDPKFDMWFAYGKWKPRDVPECADFIADFGNTLDRNDPASEYENSEVEIDIRYSKGGIIQEKAEYALMSCPPKDWADIKIYWARDASAAKSDS